MHVLYSDGPFLNNTDNGLGKLEKKKSDNWWKPSKEHWVIPEKTLLRKISRHV